MYDGGSEKCHLRSGEEKGAQIILDQLLMEQIYLENPFQQISSYLYDYDIQHPIKLRIEESDDLSIGQNLYINKLKSFLQSVKYEQIRFISLGGSWDQVYCNIDSIKQIHTNKKIGLINISAKLNSKLPVQKEYIDGQSVLREISEKYKNNIAQIIHFSTQNNNVEQNEVHHCQQNNYPIIWLNSIIRRLHHEGLKIEIQELINQLQNKEKINKLTSLLQNLYSQAALIYLQQTINLILKSEIQVVAFNCDSMDSKYCEGVSEPSVIGGLNNQEIQEIFQILGVVQPQCLIIAGFNPAVEQFKSSKFLVNLIYQYCKNININILN